MGDTDGSSSAARSAQLKNDNSKQKPLNILARIARLFSLGNKVKQLDTNENFADLKTHDNSEVGNLLRLTVEDVSIQKADIVDVCDKITKMGQCRPIWARAHGPGPKKKKKKIAKFGNPGHLFAKKLPNVATRCIFYKKVAKFGTPGHFFAKKIA